MRLKLLTRIRRWFNTKALPGLLRHRQRYLALSLTVALCSSLVPTRLPVRAAEPSVQPLAQAQTAQTQTAQALISQSRQLYEAGQLDPAETALRAAIQQYRIQGNPLGEAMAQSNLALVLGQKGQWRDANQMVEQSLSLLQAPTAPQGQSVLAQVLDVQGKLMLAQGRADAALASWQKAEQAYGQAENSSGQVRSQLRQARALQAMGFYQRAVKEILRPLGDRLATEPDSLAKVISLRELGEALQVVGSLEQSRQLLERAAAIAIALFEQAQSSDRASLSMAAQTLDVTQLSLANTLYAQALEKQRLGKRYRQQVEADQQQATTLYQAIVSRSTQSQSSDLNISEPEGLANSQPNSSPQLTAIQAQLNQLSLLIDLKQYDAAKSLWLALKPQLPQLPPNRDGINARINLAHSLLKLNQRLSSADVASPDRINPDRIEPILAVAYEQAQVAGDLRSQSYVLGQLGAVYQSQRYYDRALEFTGQATLLAKTVNAPDIIYRWYAQEGKLLKTRSDWFQQQGQWDAAEQDRQGAIAAYSQAVATLRTLRTDLATINPEVMFSFQESVEPIHRELVSLLLNPIVAPETQVSQAKASLVKASQIKASQTKSAIQKTQSQPDPATLQQVRKIMDSLRIEELHEYLRAACLEAQDVDIDQIANTTVLYPIILDNQLAIVASLPGQDLKLYSTDVAQSTLEAEVKKLRRGLLNRISFGFKQPAQQVYDWLFPYELEQAIAASPTQTLVFVLDGVLRNVPMAALYDGEQYLLEKYSLAVTPGLQLTNPKALSNQNLATVAFGLSEGRPITLPDGSRETFDDLPSVQPEVEAIQTSIPKTQTLLNQDFTTRSFAETLQSSTAPIVHLATHGKFSSDRDATFLLATPEDDDPGLIDLDQLASALAVSPGQRSQPVEMLVLSACETAVGDERAALGLAGVALRSGARSTVASLWTVDDKATSVLMENFYAQLQRQSITKAEALRQAQLAVLKDERFRRHPYVWASFILVGNWL